MSILTMENVGYAYGGGVPVLQDVSYPFEKGKIYAIVGRSGAGKTTLLSLLSALTAPTAGRILFDGRDIRQIDQYRYRSQYVGVVFQSFNLLPNLTAVENVELSMDIAGKAMPGAPLKAAEKRRRAMELLEKVELDEDRGLRRVLKLSGGEQQRVAIARALVNNPSMIIADEPTGNLDPQRSLEIMMLLERINELGTTLLVVTHEKSLVNRFSKRVVAIENGRIISDETGGYYNNGETI